MMQKAWRGSGRQSMNFDGNLTAKQWSPPRMIKATACERTVLKHLVLQKVTLAQNYKKIYFKSLFQQNCNVPDNKFTNTRNNMVISTITFTYYAAYLLVPTQNGY